MAVESLGIESRRAARVKRVQTGQHLFAAVLLLMSARAHLSGPDAHAGVMPILELAAGGLLILAVLRERLLHRKGAHPGRVGWVELAGAALVFVEALEKTRGKHHLAFVILSFVAPTALLAFGLFDLRIQRARCIVADERGIELRTRLFFKRRYAWSAIRGFRRSGTRIELALANGRRGALRLRDVKDREAAAEFITRQMRERGIGALGEPEDAPENQEPVADAQVEETSATPS
jgi:PH (Pleckstrin Homology) domain-containing protein